jgi:ABC-type sugar transport system permease subunit
MTSMAFSASGCRMLKACLRRAACFLAVVLAMANAAAAESGKNEGRITMRISGLPSPRSTGVEAALGQTMLRGFLEKYPQYDPEPFHMLAIRDGGMDEGPLMAIATGVEPHGIYVNFRQSSTYINHGFLAPLEVLLARHLSDNPRVREVTEDGAWAADPTAAEIQDAVQRLKSMVVPAVWPVIYREAEPREGIPPGKHVWALPYSTLVKALIYRKDVFKAAGLDPERPPRDWDEFVAYCRRIKTLPNTFGAHLGRGDHVSYFIYNFIVANGGRFMRQDADGRWRAAFNSRATAEAILYTLRLVKEPYTIDGKTYEGCVYAPMGSGESGIKWNRGEIGMRFEYLSFDIAREINPAITGIAPAPLAPSGQRGSELNCAMRGVFSGATPQQQLGVLRYIWYGAGDAMRRTRTDIMVKYGYGIFLDPRDLKAFGYDDVLAKVPESWKDTIELAMEHGVPEPYGKNTQQIYLKVSEPINWALDRPELLDLPRDEALRRIEARLDEAAARVDRFMLGELSPEEWRERRVWGGVLLLLIIGVFAGAITWVLRAFTTEERAMGDRPPARRFVKAYMLLAPALLLVLLVQYLPLILGVPLALFDYQFALEPIFVGLDNFATVLYDTRFWMSMLRTFYYVLLVVMLGFWPPILVAILLDEVPGTVPKYIFRTIFYLPTIVSGIIMVFLWRQLYEPSEAGFLNQILMSLNTLGPVPAVLVRLLCVVLWLSMIGFIFMCGVKLKELSMVMRVIISAFAVALLGATLYPLVEAYIGPSALQIEALGLDPAGVSGWPAVMTSLRAMFGRFQIEPLGWVEDPVMAMLCCVIPMVWATAGPGCIIYLAALKTVPEELVEAATIDGASILQRMAYITLPRVKFLILIQLLGAVVGAFRGGTDFILAMTGGGPNGATRTMGMDIFERAFMELKFSTGAAMGWILGAIVICFTAYQLRRMSRATFKTGAETSVAAK